MSVAGTTQQIDPSMQMNCGYYYPYGVPMMNPSMQMPANPYFNPVPSPAFMNQLTQFMQMMGNGMGMPNVQNAANPALSPTPMGQAGQMNQTNQTNQQGYSNPSTPQNQTQVD